MTSICPAFSGIQTLADFLVYPTTCVYYFYLFILGAMWTILTLILYNIEEDEKKVSDIFSSMGVASLVVLFTALIGTFVVNTAGIPMVQSDIFMIVLAFNIVFIILWFFKS